MILEIPEKKFHRFHTKAYDLLHFSVHKLEFLPLSMFGARVIVGQTLINTCFTEKCMLFTILIQWLLKRFQRYRYPPFYQVQKSLPIEGNCLLFGQSLIQFILKCAEGGSLQTAS